MINCIAGEKRIVQEGSQVALECPAESHHSAVWEHTPFNNAEQRCVFYYREQIYDDCKDRQRFRVQQSPDGNFYLTIEQVSISDTGVYLCTHTTGDGEACTELIVEGTITTVMNGKNWRAYNQV